MKFYILFILLLLCCQSIFAQQFRTRTAHIYVKSQNSIKNIEADNYQVRSEYDASTGDISFVGLLKSFEFKMGAIDRAYNSDRLNFGQHPKFTFEGKVENVADIDTSKPGTYQASIKGLLRLWDEKRMTRANGSIEVLADGRVKANSDFVITIEEKNVTKINDLMNSKVPGSFQLDVLSLGVSRDINIKVSMTYKKVAS